MTFSWPYFFRLWKSLLVMGYTTLIVTFSIFFLAVSSQIARAILCHFRTDLISVLPCCMIFSWQIFPYFRSRFVQSLNKMNFLFCYSNWFSIGRILKDNRDQRAFRCGFTRARRGYEWKNAVAFASVSGTATVVALRLRSSRLSACISLFRSPNRRPKRADD